MTSSDFLTDLEPNSRVILLDSSSVLKSCFEGYQATRTSSYNGRALDVAGLYGYLYRTKKIYEDLEFEALVHVMDPPGGSHHRYSLYPQYKANRKPKDPLLAAQEGLMEPMLRAFGERYTCMRGVESDDVLATMAEYLVEQGHQVMVITPDKDLLQLVDDTRGISIARYVNDSNGFKVYSMYGEKEVLDVMGVRADQVADLLSLEGDTSDNIPGVFRCGSKTAAKWLNEYGDLASLMTNADKIGGKIGESLRNTLDDLPLYQTLTTVLRDVPGTVWPSAPEPENEHHAMMREVLVLPDNFPARFGLGGAHLNPSSDQLQAPKVKPRADGTPAPSGANGGAGRGNDYAQPPAAPPTGGFSRPPRAPGAAPAPRAAQAPQVPLSNPDGLAAPAHDPLEAAPQHERPETLGEALRQSSPIEPSVSDDPFADLGLMEPGDGASAIPGASKAKDSHADAATHEEPEAQPAAQGLGEAEGRASALAGRPPRMGRR